MELAAFRASGLLELYLMGACSDDEIIVVEKALKDYPTLQSDIAEISKSLHGYAHTYAKEQGLMPSEGLKEQVLSKARTDASTSAKGDQKRTKEDRASIKNSLENTSAGKSKGTIVTTLLGLATILFGGLVLFTNQKNDRITQEYEQLQLECDSLQTASQLQYAQLEDLQNSDNQFIDITATEAYATAELTLIHNPVTRKNYLQLKALPIINSAQSFQLWSLKPDQAPIPLTVFQGVEGIFIPVDYEAGTPTYAVTIEPLGGQQAPSLENLIGTWAVSG